MTAPKRIQLRRVKGWRKPEGAVVVARPSKWGNPYRWSSRELAVEAFRLSLDERRSGFDDWAPYPSDDEIRAELAGRDLACWCPLDQPCHADVLLEIANGGSDG